MVKFTSGQKQKKKGEVNMRENGNNVTRVCSFYVNDWHLTTMLLPYINKTINENKKVLTILESGIKDNIEELLSKMNLKAETQNRILEINWNSRPVCKFSKIKDEIRTLLKDVQAINIIVDGNKEYLEIANKNIDKVTKDIKDKEITVINCHEISKYKEINAILDKNDFVLNTSGIKEIKEVFTEYKTSENNKKII